MHASSDLIALVIVATGTGVAAIIDLGTRRVPNVLTMTMASVGIIVAAAGVGRVGVTAACAGCLLGAVLMLPGHVLGATGAGDVKLLAALGTLLGPMGVLMAFVYTAIAGGALALLVAAGRGRLRDTIDRTAIFVHTRGANVQDIESATSNNRFAYAPAIAIGALVAAFGL